MGNIFAASEVVELGVQIEKNGRDFYNTLVTQAYDQRSKDLFQYLAKEEEKHIVVFQKILETLDKYEPPQVYADDYMAYMRSLAGEHIFTQANKGTEIAKKVKNEKEALDLGIKFEQDSIVFYEGMKKVVPEFDQKAVNELIAQEELHLKKLLEIKSAL